MGAQQELLDCMVSSWYPRFRAVSYSTILIPLPQPVVDWLVADGLYAAPDSEAFATRAAADPYATEDEYREWSSEEEEEAEAGSEGGGMVQLAEAPPPELAALLPAMRAAIQQLGGKVAPKLSWSSPNDALWLAPGGTLACTSPDEALLLLRGSDRVAHDVCSAMAEATAADAAAAAASGGTAADAASSPAAASAGQQGQQQGQGAVQHVLALRRWHDLQPGREFRCFVARGRLARACQRDLTQRFDGLQGEGERAALRQAIATFHASHISGNFPHPHYTYDVYVATTGQVRLLDFNPVGGTTAPLLFSWEELGLAAQHAQQAQQQQQQQGEEGASQRAQQQQGGEGASQQQAQQAGEGASQQQGGEGPEQQQQGQQQRVPEALPEGLGAAAEQGSSCSSEAGAAAAAGQAQQAQQQEGEGASYLQQLQRVQALTLAAGRDAQPLLAPQQQQQPAAADGAGDNVPTCAGGNAAAAIGGGGGSSTSGGSSSDSSVEMELRVLTEPVNLRPNKLAYGVPYDFVDASEGSALGALLAQGGADGDQLWAVLDAGRQQERERKEKKAETAEQQQP